MTVLLLAWHNRWLVEEVQETLPKVSFCCFIEFIYLEMALLVSLAMAAIELLCVYICTWTLLISVVYFVALGTWFHSRSKEWWKVYSKFSYTVTTLGKIYLCSQSVLESNYIQGSYNGVHRWCEGYGCKRNQAAWS